MIWSRRHSKEPAYEVLREDAEEKGSKASSDLDSGIHLLTEPLTCRNAKDSNRLTILLGMGCVFLAFFSTILLVRDLRRRTVPFPFEHGFATDFFSARSAIELQEVKFTGGPAYTDEGDKYIPHPSDIDYVGEPRPEIDQAWSELTDGRYIIITEEEAKSTWPEHYREYYHPSRRGYVAGLDLFHTLHCVNRIRKAFYPEYYHGSAFQHQRVHLNHCLEQIRQYIMCSGDMTPIPTKYYPSVGRNYVDSDVVHTCRNFDKLREWTTSRFVNGSQEVLPDTDPNPNEGLLGIENGFKGPLAG